MCEIETTILVETGKENITRQILEGRLAEHTDFRSEVITNTEIGITAVTTDWGVYYPWRDWTNGVARHFGHYDLVKDLDRSPNGFQGFWRANPDIDFDTAQEMEVAAATLTIHELLQNHGWGADEVDVIIVGGEPLMIGDEVSNTAAIFAMEAGLSNAQAEVHAFACNSGGVALNEALTRREFQGKKVIVMGNGAMTKEARVLDFDTADPFSWGVFADSMVAMAIVPGETMTMIDTTGNVIVEDTEAALAINFAYEDQFKPENGLVQILTEGVIAMRMPDSANYRRIQMNPSKTGLLFASNAAEMMLEFFNGRLDLINSWAFHHPSIGVIKNIDKRLRRLTETNNYDKRFANIGLFDRWQNDFTGNASAPMTLKHLARVALLDSQEGDIVGLVSMGAGASFLLAMLGIGSQEDFASLT